MFRLQFDERHKSLKSQASQGGNNKGQPIGCPERSVKHVQPFVHKHIHFRCQDVHVAVEIKKLF